MQEYICKVCGYVYKPGEGDPEGNIEVGTPFDYISSTWVCPVCGAEKTEFEPLEPVI